ncbi:MAG: hypothetical protein JNK04_16700 [Myxococcales bacterium]|nr:hypothetical protein [Myxococcales bacterium]
MKTVSFLVALALVGCTSATTPRTSPAPSPSPSPTSSETGPWVLAFSTEATGERCELAKRTTGAELRCGEAAFAPVTSDASEVVRLVEATAWGEEATRSEPDQAGPKKRSFRITTSGGSIEVLRYAEPSTSFGRIGAALDALVMANRKATSVVEPEGPRAFPAVADAGLVTVQGMSLVGPADTSTIRVASDGAWSRSGPRPSSGKLDATQLSAVRGLIDEVSRAKTSASAGLPCDALPVAASRLLIGGGRELGWSGPCAGPPPPAPAQILATYLQQIADGRTTKELEQTLSLPR